MKRAKVFVTQEILARGDDGEFRVKFDLGPAAQHGTLVFLFGHGPVALMQDAVFAGIYKRLLEEEYDPELDYVLCLGDNTLGYDLGVFLGKAFPDKPTRVLRWDRRRAEYDVLEARDADDWALKLRAAYDRGYSQPEEDDTDEQG